MRKNIGLVAALILIVGAIWYLEVVRARPGEPGPGTAPVPLVVNSAPADISDPLAALAASDKQAGYQPAVEIADPTGFVNASSSFRLADLVGKKVVLLDFWTYSCINCIRTIPYLKAWYDRYRDQGLEIVGIHTPEFEFEKNYANVASAAKKFGIEYPVILDSNRATWGAYGNLYWPHEYLIDLAGYIVHDHVGEGDYDTTETEIQKLLAERSQILGAEAAATPTSTVFVPQSEISPGLGSPETYFGAARNEYLADGTPGATGRVHFDVPPEAGGSVNALYLGGDWNFASEYAENVSAGAEIVYRYRAAKVYFVASAPAGAVVEVIQDGKPLTGAAGSDVRDGKVMVGPSRLYNLIQNPEGASEHTLELIIESPGLRAYTFTFG